MRDLPLNKEQCKEGCLMMIILGIISLIGVILLYIINN
jgi:hypothetical protein